MSSFTADVDGTYVVSLVVNDGFVDSDPANANIVVITQQSASTQALGEATVTINNLPPTAAQLAVHLTRTTG